MFINKYTLKYIKLNNLRIKIKLINKEWIDITDLTVRVVPREGEYIYLKDKYYRVDGVVHSFQEESSICVIVREINNKRIDNPSMSTSSF